MAVAEVDNYDPLSQLGHEWRSTAEVHADRKLASGLRGPVDVSGERSPRRGTDHCRNGESE